MMPPKQDGAKRRRICVEGDICCSPSTLVRVKQWTRDVIWAICQLDNISRPFKSVRSGTIKRTGCNNGLIYCSWCGDKIIKRVLHNESMQVRNF